MLGFNHIESSYIISYTHDQIYVVLYMRFLFDIDWHGILLCVCEFQECFLLTHAFFSYSFVLHVLSMFEKFLNHYLFIWTIWPMFIIYYCNDENIVTALCCYAYSIHLCSNVPFFWLLSFFLYSQFRHAFAHFKYFFVDFLCRLLIFFYFGFSDTLALIVCFCWLFIFFIPLPLIERL